MKQRRRRVMQSPAGAMHEVSVRADRTFSCSPFDRYSHSNASTNAGPCVGEGESKGEGGRERESVWG